MPEEQFSLLIAFTAGIVSFVSHCVQRTIPAYMTNPWGNRNGIDTPNIPRP
jgi:cytochrome c biogenesis protein CcdA